MIHNGIEMITQSLSKENISKIKGMYLYGSFNDKISQLLADYEKMFKELHKKD